MNKIPWFTHDNTAHQDMELRGIFRKHGGILRGFGFWWVLIELLDRHGNGDQVCVGWADLEGITHTQRRNVRPLLASLAQSGHIQIAEDSQSNLIYGIKMFRKRQSKMKSKIRSKFPEDTSKTPLDREEEGDKEKDLTPIAPSPPVSKPEEVEMEFVCKGLKGGGPANTWPLTKKKMLEWMTAFPGVSVASEMRKAQQWLKDNPTRQKTYTGMARFLGAWLGRAQDRARPVPAQPVGSKPDVDLESKYGDLNE